MNNSSTCQRCGAEIAKSDPEGLCPQCMLQDALGREVSSDAGTEEPGQENQGDSIGRYKLMEKLGEGGFGEVWVAEQREPVRRRVALKIIKLGMDTKLVVARFEAERQALALMDHPNIAKVLDAGTTERGRPYFVMELVKGIPITQYCNQEKLGTRDRLDLFIKVCHALQHAHQKGIIHRDIKPSNILVTLHDGVPVPKVIDFGIAKATQAELTEKTIYTQFHQFIGTPAYISPEQAEMSGLDIDTRSDIYSLGVLLYELLTGTTPFDTQELLRSGLDEMRKIIRECEPMRPSTRLTQHQAHSKSRLQHRTPKVEKDLDWIVMKCLEKDRTRRYETANGLAMDLKRHLSNEPVLARAPSTGYRIRKAWKRNKVTFSAATTVAASLMIGGAISIWQASVANMARNAEKEQRLAAEDAQELAEEQEEQMRRRAYAADINLAHQAIQNNNLGRALDLLNRYNPEPGKPDLRGWEWRYLWALCQTDAEFQLCKFELNKVMSAAIAPDGNWVALAGSGNMGVRIWDISKRREVAQLAVGEQSCRAAFSPDGRILAAASSEFLRLWDCSARKVISQSHINQPVSSVQFSGDGNQVVTFSQNGPIAIWDASSLRRIKVQRPPEGTSWRGFAFSPDLKAAVRVEEYNRLVAFDLETGKEHWRKTSETGFSRVLAISPDGRYVVGNVHGATNGEVYVVDMVTGREVDLLSGHRAWVSSLVFWPDGSRLASASADQTIRVWDMETLEPLHVLRGHKSEVWSLALSPDSGSLVSGSKDGAVFLWDANKKPGERNHWRIPGRHHTWSFSSDGNNILTVERNRFRVIKFTGAKYSTPQVLSEIGRGDPAFSNGLDFRFSPSGNLLAVLSTNGVLNIWDLDERRRIHHLQTDVKDGSIGVFSKEESKIWLKKLSEASRGRNHVYDLLEWDLVNGRLLQSISDVRWPLQIVPDQWVFGRHNRNAGMFHDLTTGKTFHPTMFQGRLANLIGQPSSSPDGRLLVVSHDDGVLTIWDSSDLRSNAHPDPIHAVSGILMSFRSSGFSPDGRRLLGGSHGTEAIKVWDTASYHELLTLPAEGNDVIRLRFSPNGRDLVASAHGAIFVWRAASWQAIQQGETLDAD